MNNNTCSFWGSILDSFLSRSDHMTRRKSYNRQLRNSQPLRLEPLEDRLLLATTELVSVALDGSIGNNFSTASDVNDAISADGRFVAFASDASNLVAGDTNGAWDIFVRDSQTGTTTLVSTDSGGIQGNSLALRPSISADGRYVVFESSASNLVTGDTNGFSDVFLKDLLTGTTTRVNTDSSGVQANDDGSHHPSISADGRFVAFASSASNLVAGDTNGRGDTFRKDLLTGTTTRVSTDSSGVEANSSSLISSFLLSSISADGRFVAFTSGASNLVAGDTNGGLDIFRKDLLTGTTTRVSTDSSGIEANHSSHNPSISADGRFVAFSSFASNLVPGDANGQPDIFVKDLLTGTTTIVSTDASGIHGNSDSWFPSISADGRFVAFDSNASNLVQGDTNGQWDVFAKDLQTGRITRVSTDSTGIQANSDSFFPSISADGRFVAFESLASNLAPGDTNGTYDVFVAGPLRLTNAPPVVRTRLTTLIVDIDDAGCDGAGPIYCEIQEAEDAAVPGDTIKVASGTYLPVVIDVDDITIEEAKHDSDPVIDATGVPNGVVVDADGVTITGLEVQNANSNGFLLAEGSDGNTLTDNTASNNGLAGFDLTNSDGNTLTGNTANNNGVQGFRVNSHDNTLEGNTASGNAVWGFYVSDEGNTLTGNTANENDIGGFRLVVGSDNTLERNTASDNGFYGFLVEASYGNGNTLTGNTASDNGNGGHLSGGFVLLHSIKSTLQGNTASGNSGSGFIVWSFIGRDNTLTGNTAVDNDGNGFLLEFSDGNTLTGNTASGNGLAGFVLQNSRFNTLTGNTAADNDGAGFVLQGNSDSNTLVGNTSENNENDGFFLEIGSDGNTLEGNIARKNGGYGFNVDAIIDMFMDNKCKQNELGGDNQGGAIC